MSVGKMSRILLTKLGSKYKDICFCGYCLYLERSPTFMGSQKRGEGGCLAENTGTSTLSWLGRIFLGSLWISNWTTLDPDHLSETAIAKILFGHQFAKDNPQWKFARMLSYWQFAELLTRTLICKIIDNNINLQKCCPELQFVKMSCLERQFSKMLCGMRLRKNVVQKNANFMKTYDP